MLSLALAATMLLNTAASANPGFHLRYWTAPLEALVPPLLLIAVGQLGGSSLGLRGLAALPPSAVLLSIAVGRFDLIAPVSIGSAALCLAGLIWMDRKAEYGSAPASSFARLLIVWLGAFLALRIAAEAEAFASVPVRSSGAYLLALFALLFLSTRILFLCLSSPSVLFLPPPKYRNSFLLDADMDELERRIGALLQGQKLYLQPELKLARVAELAGATEREISQVVNSRFGTNFAGLINRLRSEEAAMRLSANPSASITALVYDVGFGSKSAFQREFARRFGVSASEYRRRSAQSDVGE
jgi:AraC-like DNA-binding protein